MGFSLWTLLEASLLCLNAICILNEDRVLAKYGWSTVNREFEDMPTTKTQILSLMKSIRTVVKCIECAPHDEPVLQSLRLSTLCDRRKQGNLTFFSKLINGEVDASVLLSKVNFRVPTYCSRSFFPFHIPFSRCNYLTNRPIVRMMKLANEDPQFLSI